MPSFSRCGPFGDASSQCIDPFGSRLDESGFGSQRTRTYPASCGIWRVSTEELWLVTRGLSRLLVRLGRPPQRAPCPWPWGSQIPVTPAGMQGSGWRTPCCASDRALTMPSALSCVVGADAGSVVACVVGGLSASVDEISSLAVQPAPATANNSRISEIRQLVWVVWWPADSLQPFRVEAPAGLFAH